MAQILYYWRYPSKILFTSVDAYVSQSAGRDGNLRSISIDADATTLDFPDFGDLNSELANLAYNGDMDEIAHLCFGTGVKLRMSYSNQGSGAWRPSAYRQGFAYGSARKDDSGWPNMRQSVIDNMKAGWPVQIAMYGWTSTQPPRPVGHSVVLDGYRDSDDTFHINYGWGGTNDTWYNLPNVNNYDTITSVIYDICPFQGWNQVGADGRNTFQCPYAGPLEAKEKWHRSCSDAYSFGGLVVGTGNRIYAACSPRVGSQSYHPSLWIINQYGEKENEIVLQDENEGLQPPAQDSKGRVFLATDLGRVYRFDPDTNTMTRIFTEPQGQQLHDPPKLDDSGHIYVNTFWKVYCLDSSGTVLWVFTAPNNGWINWGMPAVDGSRNRLYIGYYEDSTKTSHLAAISTLSGTIQSKKSFAVSSLFWMNGFASLGSAGTVYVGCAGTLYALDPDNNLAQLWQQTYPVAQRIVNPPAVGYDGTLYITYCKQTAPTYKVAVAALNPANGNTKWEVPFTVTENESLGMPYVMRNKLVVFSMNSAGLPDTWTLYGYRDLGTGASQAWKWECDSSGGDIAFGPGATVYVRPTSGYGHIITAITEGATGDPDGAGMGYTDDQPPSVPGNPSPAVGTSDWGQSVTLSWTCSHPLGHALKYTVLLGDATTNMSPVARDLYVPSYNAQQLEPGTCYIWSVVATDGQTIAEGPVWTFTTKGEGGKPGFVVTAIEIDPPSPCAGSTFTAKVTVRNKGDAAGNAGRLSVWRYKPKGLTFPLPCDERSWSASKTVGVLAAGQEKTITFSGLPTGAAGAKTFCAFVDSYCETDESDESNNQLCKDYTVACCGQTDADFYVSKIELDPPSPCAGGTFDAKVTVCNRGTAACNGGWLSIWRHKPSTPNCDDPSWSARKPVGVLAAGECRTITFGNLPCGATGAKTFRAFVDSDCDTVELREDNNQVTKSYTVGCCGQTDADFKVTSITLTPSSLCENRTFDAKVEVRNIGTAPCDGGWLSIWRHRPSTPNCDDPSWSARKPVGVLAAGERKTITFHVLPSGAAGAKTFRAFVDSYCETAEADESNNQMTTSYRVGCGTPDFVVTSIRLIPASPVAGGTFTADVTVKNKGAGAGDGGWLAVYRHWPATQPNPWPMCGDKSSSQRCRVKTLVAGESRTYRFTGLASGGAGNKRFVAFVDSQCETVERTEGTNNKQALVYTVR